MKEYKIAKIWAILIYLGTILLVGFFGGLLIFALLSGKFSLKDSWVFIPISIGMILLMLLGAIEAFKGKLVINEDKVISINTFSKKELKFNEIKGYTFNKYYIFIVPSDENKKQIQISKYFEGYDEILYWLSQTFNNLDKKSMLNE